MNVEVTRGFSWQNQGVPEELHAGDQRMVPDTVGRRWVQNGWAKSLEPDTPDVRPRTLAAPETKGARPGRR